MSIVPRAQKTTSRPLRRTSEWTGWRGRNAFRDLPDNWLVAEAEDLLRERAAYVEQLALGCFPADVDAHTTRNSIADIDRRLALIDRERTRRLRLERYGAPKAPDPRTVSLAARFDRARALDIVDVIAKLGDVWFSGPSTRGEYTARCPFADHEDRNPSFTANSEKGVFHCWGCGRKGDVIAFAQHWFGCAFRPEALDHLEHALRLREIAP